MFAHLLHDTATPGSLHYRAQAFTTTLYNSWEADMENGKLGNADIKLYESPAPHSDALAVVGITRATISITDSRAILFGMNMGFYVRILSWTHQRPHVGSSGMDGSSRVGFHQGVPRRASLGPGPPAVSLRTARRPVLIASVASVAQKGAVQTRESSAECQPCFGKLCVRDSCTRVCVQSLGRSETIPF